MSKVKTIHAEAAAQLLTEENLLILDCRDTPDYKTGHIEGAIHSHDDLIESLVRKGDKSRKVLIYCYSGHRSEHLTEFLTQFGYQNAYNLVGGYASWEAWLKQQA